MKKIKLGKVEPVHGFYFTLSWEEYEDIIFASRDEDEEDDD